MGIKSRIELTKNQIQGALRVPKPLYNHNVPISGEYPEVYNSEGRAYEFFFLRDIHTAHAPYEGTGKYFLWDRYNYGLKIHFYGHNAMLKTVGAPDKKYGKLTEARSIVPRDYEIFRKHPGLEREFERILTFDDEILNSVGNAVFYPVSADPWYRRDGEWDGLQYEKKDKMISFLSSDKEFTPGHRYRAAAARYCHREKLAQVYGRVVKGGYVAIEEPLEKYRYSIIVENEQKDYYFTEKITNCFASQTVPIYCGARKIDDFFNTDGIIPVSPEDLEPGKIEKLIAGCSIDDYEGRRNAILDNFERVKKYRNMNDYLYENCM